MARGTFCLICSLPQVVRVSASQAAQLDLIRRSVYAQEPGGGRLTEVIRILPGHAEVQVHDGGSDG